MAAGTQSRPERAVESDSPERPEVSVCESCPGTSIFLESGNTDGWMASDVTVEVLR